MSFKKCMLIAHRWLGLVTGLVVLVVSITGCLFVFHQEISRWARSDVMFVEPPSKNAEIRPVAELEKRAEQTLGVDRLPYGLTTYQNPKRAWKALNYEAAEGNWTYFGNIEDYRTVYLNPYNGEVMGVVNEQADFFQIVKGLHWSLLLATPIGQPIVTWSTVVFIVLLLTGIVLWWPKRWNRSGRHSSFRLKWKSTWRRLNYDLHNVLGFYSLLLAFIIAFTGLYWAFPTVQKTLYFAGTGEWSLPSDQPETVVKSDSTTSNVSEAYPLQIAFEKAWEAYPEVHNITLVRPSDSARPLEAHIRPSRETYYDENHMLFDPATGEVEGMETFESKNAGEKLLAMNYDIHVGAIGGIFGKMLAFLASLVCASLPVTGFIIWFNRKQRERRRNRRREKSRARIQKEIEYHYTPEPTTISEGEYEERKREVGTRDLSP